MTLDRFFIFLLAMACIAVVGCQQQPQQPPAGNGPIVLPDTFYMHLHGNIGKAPATMELFRQGEAVFGSYYPDSGGFGVALAGFVDSLGQYSIATQNDEGQETGSFKGRFATPTTFTGTKLDETDSVELAFSLTEVHAGVNNITVEHLREEACEHRRPADRIPAEERESWNDTLCPYVDVTLLQIETANPEIAASINQRLREEIYDADSDNKSLEQFMQGIHTLKAGQWLGETYHYQLLRNDKDLLTVGIKATLDDGEAFPIFVYSTLNFDLRTGRLLQLQDVLTKEGVAKVVATVQDFVTTFLPDDNKPKYGPAQFAQSYDFEINNTGLVFRVDLNEGTGQMATQKTIPISFATLQGTIQLDGVLQRFVR